MRKEKYIVEQTKNGSTYLVVKFTYKAGTAQKTYSKTFTVKDYASKKEAMEAACKHRDLKRAELLTVGLPDKTVMYPRQLLEMAMQKEHLSAKSKRLYYGVFDRHLAEYNEYTIQQIGPMDIEESMAKYRYTHSQQILSIINTIWKKIFRMARRLNLVSTNPMEQVDIPKSKYIAVEKTTKVTSDEEIDKVIQALAESGRSERSKYDNQIIIGIILVLRYTGIRPAECMALKRSSIDFERQVIKIEQSYGSNEDGKAIVGTKTKLSRREVPMTMACAMALRSIMEMSDNEYIFAMYDGKLHEVEYIDAKIWSANKKAGTSFHLYAARHQFASDLITSGVDPRTVMELMGHSSTDMTVGTYARSNDEIKKNALVEIGRKISEEGEKIQRYMA